MLKKETQNFVYLSTILLMGAVLRLYRIRDYLVFLGDEGRDALVVKRIVVDHVYTLLGPITSVGGMYLGPIYYYFMAPFFWLFNLDPVGPAVMIVLMFLITTYFIFRLAADFLNSETAILSSLLYATSPLVITYSRSSWNPNAVPLFAILIIYGLLQAFIAGKRLWLFVVGLAFGIILQLHYLALVLFGVMIVAGIILQPKLQKIDLLKLILGFLVSLSPFLLFELRHGFPNTQTILRFITKGGSEATFSFFSLFTRLLDIGTRLFWRLVIIEGELLTQIIMILVSIGYFLLFIHPENTTSRERQTLKILIIWFFVGIGAYSLYTGAIYDYYFVPLFPLPFILLGLVLSRIWQRSITGRYLVLIAIVILLFIYGKKSPFRQEPNRLLYQTQVMATFAYSLTDGKPYNFALISSGNSDHAYRYFFERFGRKPVTIENKIVDPERKTRTHQLIVICEDRNCQPLGHSLWEIAGFEKADVVGQWDIVNVKIFKLVPA